MTDRQVENEDINTLLKLNQPTSSLSAKLRSKGLWIVVIVAAMIMIWFTQGPE